MRRFLLTMIALLTSLVGLWAQAENEGRQILVFRNTGEVNLFYSNELDSITLNDTAQVFHSVDTTLIVPLAELDSVAVGSRNEIVVNKSVRRLTDEVDIPWLIRTEDNSLFYRKDTPASILPKIGEKLYYAESCELMPSGLVGKVASVSLIGDEYEVMVEDVDLAEIFDKLLYAGRMESRPNAAEVNGPRRAPIDIYNNYIQPLLTNGRIFLAQHGEIEIKGETNIVLDYVVNVRRHYYYAHIRGNTEIGLEFSVHSNLRDNVEQDNTRPLIEIPLPVVAGVLHPVLYANLFCEVKADLRLKLSAKRNVNFDYEWTREKGQNKFVNHGPTGDERYNDEAKLDILMDGEIYAGATIGLGLNLVSDRAGVRFRVQAGPYVKGEFGWGVLANLRNHNAELYPKAEIEGGARIRIKADLFYRRRFGFWGNEVEHPLYTHEFNLFPRKLNLFPQYERSRAVAQVNTQKETKVTVATAVPEPTPTPLETGFEVVDPEGEVVDSIYVGTIESQQEVEVGEQYFDSLFYMPNNIDIEELDAFTVRPIFHYAGYTVSAAPFEIVKDPNMQPYTSYLSNGAMAFISSGPFLNRAEQDSTLYTLGAYLPVPPKKLLTDKPKQILDIGEDITEERAETLVGTWSGELGGFEVTIVFNEDGTGNFTSGKQNPKPFDYELNTPQMGEVLITFEDDSDLVLLLRFIDDSTLEVINKRDETRTVKTFKRE